MPSLTELGSAVISGFPIQRNLKVANSLLEIPVHLASVQFSTFLHEEGENRGTSSLVVEQFGQVLVTVTGGHSG
jgi:hypothetical protein